MASSLGTASSSTTRWLFRSRRWTLPARAIFFTPDSFTHCCKVGRCKIELLLQRPTLQQCDIFHAGFIYALLQGWPLQKQLDFACAAAALNCTAVGARGAIHPVAQIEHLLSTGPRHTAAFAIPQSD